MPFNIPQDQLNNSSYTGCPPGYILVDGACVHPLTEEIFEVAEAAEYDFEYYENAGELVGKYSLGVIGNPITPSVYFAQNLKIIKFKDIGISNAAMNLSPDDALLAMDFTHSYNSGAPTTEITQDFLSTDDTFKNTFKFGEFFLLPNNPTAIKRINLNYQVIHDNGSIDIPLPIEGADAIVKWYFGYVRIPSGDRPDNMLVDTPTPTIAYPIQGTDYRLTWQTLRDTCFRYIRVYDQSNLNASFSEVPRNGQYLIQLKCVVDEDKLQEFMNANTDSSEYVDEERDYKILFYPPSFYSYPADSISDIDTPSLNALNQFIDEVIFEAPKNYKTDGNIHYSIDFLTAKNSTDILFQTSSYEGHEHFEGFQWYISTDKENWTSTTPRLPSFNNLFDEVSGTDSEKTVYIKYELSDVVRELLRDRADILFKIKQLDGTLVK